MKEKFFDWLLGQLVAFFIKLYNKYGEEWLKTKLNKVEG